MSLNGLMVWINFIISYSLFPGVMLLKKYSFITTTWNTTLMVCNYNLFGTFGKLLAIFKIYNDKYMTILVILRLFFYSSFFSIVFTNNSLTDSYWFAHLNISLFALSEGYAMSSHLNLASSKLRNQFNKTLGSYIMGFPIQFGLLSGSLVGYIFKFYI